MTTGTGATTGTTNTSTTTGTAAASQASFANDMNSFLTLLTAQLQHQDPLSPMDSSQFTNQLVQFASVQQEIDINSNLEKMLTTQNSSSMASAITYIGTSVQGVSTQLPLQDGKGAFSYTTPATAATINAVITDSAGNVVKAIPLNPVAGTYTYNWDGTDSYGKQSPDGTYNIAITSVAADNTQTSVDAAVIGTVTSIGMDANNQVQLYMGGVNLALQNVIKVVAPASSSASSTASSTADSIANAANAVNSAVNGSTTD
jgi:flagellar basal-body rod modification protein FlgD